MDKSNSGVESRESLVTAHLKLSTGQLDPVEESVI